MPTQRRQLCVWFELRTAGHRRRSRSTAEAAGSGPPGEGADGAQEAALPPDLKPPMSTIDYPIVINTSTKAGPVPDRLTISQFDRRRYRFDATFQGVSARRADVVTPISRAAVCPPTASVELDGGWTLRFRPLRAPVSMARALSAFVF